MDRRCTRAASHHPVTASAPGVGSAGTAPSRRHRARLGTVGALGAAVAVALLASACGSSSSATTTTATTTTAASGGGSTPTTVGGGTPTTAGGGAVVKTASVGTLGTILVTASGRTLYYYTPDTSTKIACTGGCAQTWPPLGLGSGMTTATGVSGLGTIKRPDSGALQVTYQGKPLYTYVGDTEAGQANGQGVGGTWYVLKLSSGGSSSATTTTAARSGY